MRTGSPLPPSYISPSNPFICSQNQNISVYINHYRPIVVVWYISLVLEYIPFILLCSLFKNRRVTHGVSNYRLSHLLLSVSCWFDLPGCFASRCIVGHSSDVEHWLVGRVVRFLSRHLCTTSTLKFIPFFLRRHTDTAFISHNSTVFKRTFKTICCKESSSKRTRRQESES